MKTSHQEAKASTALLNGHIGMFKSRLVLCSLKKKTKKQKTKNKTTKKSWPVLNNGFYFKYQMATNIQPDSLGHNEFLGSKMGI